MIDNREEIRNTLFRDHGLRVDLDDPLLTIPIVMKTAMADLTTQLDPVLRRQTDEVTARVETAGRRMADDLTSALASQSTRLGNALTRHEDVLTETTGILEARLRRSERWIYLLVVCVIVQATVSLVLAWALVQGGLQ